MKNVREIKFHAGSKEELLPDFTPEFPYLASRVELDHYHDRTVPWHWHGAVELSYTLRGCIKYYTPGGVSFLPLEQARPLLDAPARGIKSSGKVKQMMVYIHERFGEKLTVEDIAASSFLSQRECFRVFQECLHTTPAEAPGNKRR